MHEPWTAARRAALALWCIPGLSRRKAAALVAKFGGVVEAVAALAGTAELIERTLAAAAVDADTILLPGDADWPAGLEALADPPGALFVRGRFPAAWSAVAVVGSRQPNAAGVSFAEGLARSLAAEGVLVVSGGALGIDGAAHRGTLGSGPSLAVLAGGLDRPYPPQHAGLFTALVSDGGGLVSEIPYGVPPLAELFPRRNRLIAALGQATVVVQAARRSGSLITAREARALHRPVLAVPGTPGDAVAAGTNDLLRQGAGLCTGVDDVWAALGRARVAEGAGESAAVDLAGQFGPLPTGDPGLDRLAQLLPVTPRPLDEIARKSGLLPSQLAASLSRLELLGLARRAPGGHFYRPMPSSPATGHRP